jgi:hypothetical protein
MLTANDPQLHLIVDGVPFQPQSVIGQVYTFKIPARAQVTIASRSVVPREVLGDALPDPLRWTPIVRQPEPSSKV